MSRIIDLSYDITHQMKVFPADPAVGILKHHDYQNGYFVSQVIFGTHTGTHIDVPVHKIQGGRTVDEEPIDHFTGRALVVDIPGLKPLEEITPAHLEKYADRLDGVHAVILRTNWGKHFGMDDFFTSFPGLGEEAVDWLHSHQITLIGLESPSVNALRHQEIHTRLLEKEMLIVESLAHVDQLPTDYVEFFAVPLKLKGLDGSPVRAFARTED